MKTLFNLEMLRVSEALADSPDTNSLGRANPEHQPVESSIDTQDNVPSTPQLLMSSFKCLMAASSNHRGKFWRPLSENHSNSQNDCGIEGGNCPTSV